MLCFVACVSYCLFECYGDHRDLHVLTHSFPTRRSSDLVRQLHEHGDHWIGRRTGGLSRLQHRVVKQRRLRPRGGGLSHVRRPSHRDGATGDHGRDGPARSEENPSELPYLMSTSYAVFCLKKKKTMNPHTNKVR